MSSSSNGCSFLAFFSSSGSYVPLLVVWQAPASSAMSTGRALASREPH